MDQFRKNKKRFLVFILILIIIGIVVWRLTVAQKVVAYRKAMTEVLKESESADKDFKNAISNATNIDNLVQSCDTTLLEFQRIDNQVHTLVPAESQFKISHPHILKGIDNLTKGVTLTCQGFKEKDEGLIDQGHTLYQSGLDEIYKANESLSR